MRRFYRNVPWLAPNFSPLSIERKENSMADEEKLPEVGGERLLRSHADFERALNY